MAVEVLTILSLLLSFSISSGLTFTDQGLFKICVTLSLINKKLLNRICFDFKFTFSAMVTFFMENIVNFRYNKGYVSNKLIIKFQTAP